MSKPNQEKTYEEAVLNKLDKLNDTLVWMSVLVAIHTMVVVLKKN